MTTPTSTRRRRHLPGALAVLAAALAVLTSLVGVLPATAAEQVIYQRDETIPVPPASTYSGSAGGDGWNVALSDTEVFNVFHHASDVRVACHKQSDATECYPARTLLDGAGRHFGASGHSGAYYDPTDKNVYVFTVRDDLTAGVVCFDSQTAATQTNPFCGFTPLTAVGKAETASTPFISEGAKVGNRWFAFSWNNGVGALPDQNALLCFDLSTHAACAGQPFAPALGAGTLMNVGNFPPPATTAIAGRVLIGIRGAASNDMLTCFDTATNATCTGTWPVPVPPGYTGGAGAPFPLLNASGGTIGFCLPFGTDPCFNFTGGPVATPAGMAAAIPTTSGWNGSAVTIGSRVYLPNGNNNEVNCYNAATDASCANFPKDYSGTLSLMYTVNPDPNRPACLWVNADSGSQINNFDAFTGGGCGQGAIRVLGSSFVAPGAACVPGSYVSLQVLSPPRGSYASGSVKFLDGDANQLPIADRQLDGTGTVSLTGLNLNSAAGLPQFLVSLNGIAPSSVTLRLTWQGQFDPACAPPGTVVTRLPGGPPPPTSGKCHKVQATIRGTSGNDTIFGTPGNDVIIGLDGNDVITGGGGRDIICGRAGEDIVVGGRGDDIYLSGGRGDDEVYGSEGDDNVFGRDDDDLVVGGLGDDSIHGNAQNDVAKGGNGDDKVDGGHGDDELTGNRGTNLLRGGPGNDVCPAPSARNTVVSC